MEVPNRPRALRAFVREAIPYAVEDPHGADAGKTSAIRYAVQDPHGADVSQTAFVARDSLPFWTRDGG